MTGGIRRTRKAWNVDWMAHCLTFSCYQRRRFLTGQVAPAWRTGPRTGYGRRPGNGPPDRPGWSRWTWQASRSSWCDGPGWSIAATNTVAAAPNPIAAAPNWRLRRVLPPPTDMFARAVLRGICENRPENRKNAIAGPAGGCRGGLHPNSAVCARKRGRSRVSMDSARSARRREAV